MQIQKVILHDFKTTRENFKLNSITEEPCGTKFLQVLIFAIFPTIPKNKFPQKLITANIFPAKIYSRVNAL